eukprot:scaffold2498_cov114-Isochrysis_galbana.AAC.4
MPATQHTTINRHDQNTGSAQREPQGAQQRAGHTERQRHIRDSAVGCRLARAYIGSMRHIDHRSQVASAS